MDNLVDLAAIRRKRNFDKMRTECNGGRETFMKIMSELSDDEYPFIQEACTPLLLRWAYPALFK